MDNKKPDLRTQLKEMLPIVTQVIFLILQVCYHIFESLFRKFYPEPLKSVKNETVLITGAGHGMGRELALLYAAEESKLVLLDINMKGIEETAKNIEDLGYQRPTLYKCDVSNHENVKEVANKVKKEVGNITILINNAGIMPTRPLMEQTDDEIDRTLKINVYSHLWIIREFLPEMIKSNHGHIVAMSSIAGIVGLNNLVPYCASKFAVRGLMESLSEELRAAKNNKIKFTTIYPFMVDTGLCKNPFIKFPSLTPLLKPKSTAKAIMKAQRSGVKDATVPRYMFPLNNFARLLPEKASNRVVDFFESGVKSDFL